MSFHQQLLLQEKEQGIFPYGGTTVGRWRMWLIGEILWWSPQSSKDLIDACCSLIQSYSSGPCQSSRMSRNASWTLSWSCVCVVCVHFTDLWSEKNRTKCFAHSHIPLTKFLDIKAGVMTVKVVSFYSRKGCHAHTFKAGVYLRFTVWGSFLTYRSCQEVFFFFAADFMI